MSNVTQTTKAESGRMKSGHAKDGYRIVHTAVPDRVFNHVKAQAFLSNMTWPAYLTELLANAKPLQPPTPGTETKG